MTQCIRRKEVGMDNIKLEISEIGWGDVDRIQLAQNIVYWRDFENTAEALLDQMKKHNCQRARTATQMLKEPLNKTSNCLSPLRLLQYMSTLHGVLSGWANWGQNAWTCSTQRRRKHANTILVGKRKQKDNSVIRTDFQMPTVKEEISRFSSLYAVRLRAHTNELIATLTGPPIHKRLRRYWPNNLLTRF
jgi:hypothetical protein